MTLIRISICIAIYQFTASLQAGILKVSETSIFRGDGVTVGLGVGVGLLSGVATGVALGFGAT
jgi:hypothetical protein